MSERKERHANFRFRFPSRPQLLSSKQASKRCMQPGYMKYDKAAERRMFYGLLTARKVARGEHLCQRGPLRNPSFHGRVIRLELSVATLGLVSCMDRRKSFRCGRFEKFFPRSKYYVLFFKGFEFLAWTFAYNFLRAQHLRKQLYRSCMSTRGRPFSSTLECQRDQQRITPDTFFCWAEGI